MNICSFSAHGAPVIGYVHDDHDRLVAHRKRPAIALFAGGAHGISMCNQEVETPYPAAEAWVGLCKTWLNNPFDYIP